MSNASRPSTNGAMRDAAENVRPVELMLGVGGGSGNGLDAVGEEQPRNDQCLVHGAEMRGPRDLLTIGTDRQKLDSVDGDGNHSLSHFLV